MWSHNWEEKSKNGSSSLVRENQFKMAKLRIPRLHGSTEICNDHDLPKSSLKRPAWSPPSLSIWSTSRGRGRWGRRGWSWPRGGWSRGRRSTWPRLRCPWSSFPRPCPVSRRVRKSWNWFLYRFLILFNMYVRNGWMRCVMICVKAPQQRKKNLFILCTSFYLPRENG